MDYVAKLPAAAKKDVKDKVIDTVDVTIIQDKDQAQ